MQWHFVWLGLTTRPGRAGAGGIRPVRSETVNEPWTGDAFRGPHLAVAKAILSPSFDVHGRARVGYRWAHREDPIRLEPAHSVPEWPPGAQRIHVGNGSPLRVQPRLLRGCAMLGVKLTHATPAGAARPRESERSSAPCEQFPVELAHPTTAVAVVGGGLGGSFLTAERRASHA